MATPAYTDIHALLPCVSHVATVGSAYGRSFLTDTRWIEAPNPLVAGARYTIVVKQPPWGGQTLLWDAAYQFAGGVPPTLPEDPDARSVLEFVSDGTSLFCVSVQTGLA